MRQPSAVSLLCALGSLRAGATGPAYETDHQLAQSPLIVVAKWNKAELTPHELVEGNVLEKFEVFTDLEVERVIKGDLKPGRYKIMHGWGIGWLKDGTGLATWTSTEDSPLHKQSG